MSIYAQRFIFSSTIYLLSFSFIYFIVSPTSVLSVIGFIAAIASSLIVIWGGSAILGFIVSAISFLAFSHLFYGLNIELAIIIVFMFTCVLQGVWTKHLLSSYIHKQRWLSSRKILFQFLMLLGPCTAFISAFAALVIANIETAFESGSYFYSFFVNGACSILVSIFITPLLLLRAEQQNLNKRKRHFISAVAIMGAIALGVIFKISIEAQQHQDLDNFNDIASNVKQKINKEVNAVEEKVNSVVSLFKASDTVTLNEFNMFTKNIHHKPTSIRAIEWAPIVVHQQRDEFSRLASKVLNRKFMIKERMPGGRLQKTKQRALYAPLYFIYPEKGNERVYGLDIYSNPAEIHAINEGRSHNIIKASGPLTLLQSEKQTRAFLFTQSVYGEKKYSLRDRLSDNHKIDEVQNNSLKKEELQGYVVAVVEYETFFKNLSYLDDKDIVVLITDRTKDTEQVIHGESKNKKYRNSVSFTVEVYSRHWEVTLQESKPWYIQSKSIENWGMVVGITLAGVIFQLLILMTVTYTVELNKTVNKKTEALKKTKKTLETENKEKLMYLKNLNEEFNLPLQYLIAMVKEYKKAPKNLDILQTEKTFKTINQVTNSMSQLLDNMLEFSKIDSGSKQMKTVTFDFHGLVERIEKSLTVNNTLSLSCLLTNNVPHFIQGDEHLLQRLLVSLSESAQRIFGVEQIRLSINVHENKTKQDKDYMTMFFILVPHNSYASQSENSDHFENLSKENIALYSTQMAMVKEMCELQGGDVNFNLLSTGQGILSASIIITASTAAQVENHQSKLFDQFTI